MPINRWPAWLDIIQGLTGLGLVVFMWTHMFMVSSILISNDAMYFVTKMFEGQPIFGRSYPILVSLFAIFITLILVIHAFLALRKFPSSYRAYHSLHVHLSGLRHPDTWLWYIQVITGFMLFFLAPVHLYQLITHPADIGPYASSNRVWTGMMWPLYLVMLFAVELHASIGFYRLVVKWNLFGANNLAQTRARLRTIKWLITLFFISLGLFTLFAYIKIGIAQADKLEQRYSPSIQQSEQKARLL